MQKNTTSAPPQVFARVESLSMKETDKKIGAGNEARTRDLNLGKVALYQLSYSRFYLEPSRILIQSTWQMKVGVP